MCWVIWLLIHVGGGQEVEESEDISSLEELSSDEQACKSADVNDDDSDDDNGCVLNWVFKWFLKTFGLL